MSLLDALAAGAVRLRLGRIRGRCGYVNLRTRTIVLNPDAAPDELEGQLCDSLAHLGDQPPNLRVVRDDDVPPRDPPDRTNDVATCCE